MNDEIAKLQGTWIFVTLEIEGMKVPDSMFADSKMIIKDDTFKTISKVAIYEGTFKVDDATQKPATLDLTFTKGPEKGNTSLGIYERDGDSWKICLSLRGKDRPKEFATKPSSGFALETLKRQSP